MRVLPFAGLLTGDRERMEEEEDLEAGTCAVAAMAAAAAAKPIDARGGERRGAVAAAGAMGVLAAVTEPAMGCKGDSGLSCGEDCCCCLCATGSDGSKRAAPCAPR